MYHLIYSGECVGCGISLTKSDSRVTSADDIFRIIQRGFILDQLYCSECQLETRPKFVTVVEAAGLRTTVKVDALPIKEFFRLEPADRGITLGD